MDFNSASQAIRKYNELVKEKVTKNTMETFIADVFYNGINRGYNIKNDIIRKNTINKTDS